MMTVAEFAAALLRDFPHNARVVKTTRWAYRKGVHDYIDVDTPDAPDVDSRTVTTSTPHAQYLTDRNAVLVGCQ